MKVCQAVTNSSTFVSLAWYSPNETTLPINEPAWLACRLMREDTVVVPDTAINYFRGLSECPMCVPPINPQMLKKTDPQLIASWKGFFPPRKYDIVGVGDRWQMSAYLLQFLSQCRWESGDEIYGVCGRDDWSVGLLRVRFVAGDGIGYGGTVATLSLHEDFANNHLPEIMRRVKKDLRPPSRLKQAIDWVLECERNSGDIAAVAWFGDVLTTRYYCFWQFNSLVVAFSPVARRETEKEDIREICYGGSLFVRRKMK